MTEKRRRRITHAFSSKEVHTKRYFEFFLSLQYIYKNTGNEIKKTLIHVEQHIVFICLSAQKHLPLYQNSSAQSIFVEHGTIFWETHY